MVKRRNQRRAANRAEKRRARLRDSGPDPSGNYDVSPYAARGHVVEVAPKELRSNPNSTQYPRRIVTQRMLDRYLAHGHITPAEWRAGDAMWQLHCELGRNARVTSGYDPVMVSTSPSMDGRLAKYLDAALFMTRLKRAIPYRCIGVVEAVVIEDRSASEWAKERGKGDRDSKGYGLARLRAGLQALADSLGH